MDRYFFMDMDHTLMDLIGLKGFDISGRRHIFTCRDEKRVNDITSLYLDGAKGECAPDFIKSPVYMVSEMAWQVISMYEDGLPAKKIVLIHQEEGSQLTYYHLLLEEAGVLVESSGRRPDGMRFCLDREKTGDHKAFLPAGGKARLPVVSLEVVESLLRRHVMGVWFKEIGVI